jgi:hypothetical protein
VDDQAAICTSFTKTITVDNSLIVAGDVLTIGASSIVADTDFAIGVNSATTASNIAAFLASVIGAGASISSAANVVLVSYSSRGLSITSSNAAALAVQSTITIDVVAVPDSIVAGGLVDILQTDGGHSTLGFDVLLAAGSVSPTSITLSEDQLPENFVVGDYICAQYECIVPQVPTDLHNLLAERTCARILESLGDKEGLQAANTKIAALENKQSTILDNRVEGAPLKVLNRSGLLRASRNGYGRRG